MISENIDKFIKILDDFDEEQSKLPYLERNICPPPTDAQLVVNCLCDLFLGEGWYVGMPLSTKQVNTIILDNILYMKCRKYRRLSKKKVRDK